MRIDCLKKIWNYLKESRGWLFWFCFLLVVVCVGIIIICPSFSSDWIKSATNQDEIYALLYFATWVATALLALIAWKQLTKIYSKNEAEFLLKIDEQWGSDKIIKARQIIHKIYIKIEPKHKEKKRDNIFELVGQEILNMRLNNEEKGEKKKQEDKDKEQDDFIILLNFLDFMETIGYLYEKKLIKADELNALCGESIRFNYKIFTPYIRYKRQKHQREKFYESFEALYNELKKLDKKK